MEPVNLESLPPASPEYLALYQSLAEINEIKDRTEYEQRRRQLMAAYKADDLIELTAGEKHALNNLLRHGMENR